MAKKKTNPRKLSGNLASAYLLILMLVLHDELGFGKKRIMHIYTRVCDISDSVSNGLITFEDIRQTLIKECKWDIDNAYVERRQDEAYWHVVEHVGGVNDETK